MLYNFPQRPFSIGKNGEEPLLTPWSIALVLAAALRTVVLPFENLSSDPAHDWKGSAFEEAISSHLESAGIQVVDLGSRNRQLREKGFTPDEPITRASAIVVAKDLEADRLIVGEFEPIEGRIEVTARVIDLTKGSTLGMVEDYAQLDELPRLLNLTAKNVLRLERDDVPQGFAEEAARREKIPVGALELGARARTRFDRAEQKELLEQALARSADYLEARLLLGSVLLEEGLPREASEVLAHARGQGPLYRRAYFSLGLAYLDAGEPDLAYEVYRNLTAGEGANPIFHNNLGVSLMRLDRYSEATAAFEKARELGGATRTYLFNLGWSYWRAGKGAQALELFEKIAAVDPLDAEAHWLLSASAFSQARPDLAATSRQTALLLAPHLESVDASTVSGWERPLGLAQKDADPSWATASLEIEEDVFGMMELLDARALRSRGRSADAIRLLQRSLYRDPNDVHSRRELAEIYLEKGELEPAASELSVLLWNEPTPEAHVQLARLYLRMAEPTKAFEELRKALALDPDHAAALGLQSEIAAQ